MEKYFTTSKGVHVGRLWVNRCEHRPIDDPDMQMLQVALTMTPDVAKQRKERFIRYWEVAIGLVILIGLGISYRPEQVPDSKIESSYKQPPKKYVEDPKYWFLKINKHHKEVAR